MDSSESGDLRGLVGALTAQQTRFEATINELRSDFSKLQEKYDALVAWATAQRHEEAQRQRGTAKKHEFLAGRRRLSPAVSTKRRGLSSGTCTAAQEDAPALLVEGVCSCTEGLLVEGWNVSGRLDSLEATCGATGGIVTPPVVPTGEATCSYNCTLAGDACSGGTVQDFNGTVYCDGPSACEGTTFVRVGKVVCRGDSACDHAVFVNVTAILCSGDDSACQYIDATHVDSVVCEGLGEYTCYYPDFIMVRTVHCVGDGTSICAYMDYDHGSLADCTGDGDYLCYASRFGNVESVNCSGDGYVNCYTIRAVNASVVTCDGNNKYNCEDPQLFDVNVWTCTGSGSNCCSKGNIVNSNNDYSGFTCTATACGNGIYGPQCGDADPGIQNC